MGELQDGKINPPHYTGHRERLRERFRTAGDERDRRLRGSWSSSCSARFRVRTSSRFAKQLIGRIRVVCRGDRRFGGSPQDGEGPLARPATILDFKVVHAASRRIARSSVVKRQVLSSWSAVIDYCRTAMDYEDREQFRVLFLDKKNQMIADEVQQTGTVDHTPVYPRRGGEKGAGAGRHGGYSRPQSPLRRPDPVAGRYHHDQTGDRRRRTARHRRARPHHHRSRRPCQSERGWS